MPQSFACLHHHLIFSTEVREPLLGASLRPRLFAYVGGTLRAVGCTLTAAGGMPDHVHLLVSLDRQRSVSNALRVIKSNSSRWIHETFPDLAGFAWQNGYGAFAVSHSHRERVKRYIDGQEEHHRTISFQEEYVGSWRRHDIEFGERHLWD